MGGRICFSKAPLDANKIPQQLRGTTSVLYWSVNNGPQAPTLQPFEIMIGVHSSLWKSIRKNKRKELGRAERGEGERGKEGGRERKREERVGGSRAETMGGGKRRKTKGKEGRITGKERTERWKGR